MRFPVNNWELFNTTAGNSFGAKVPYGFHSGTDVNGNGGGNSDCGIPLLAIADWECTSVHIHETGYGHHLHYKINVGGKDYFVHYAHCKDISIKVGDKGKEGDLLATLGSSGNSDYCHLHMEIKNQPTGIDGIAKTKEDLKKWEDPVAFIDKWYNVPEDTSMQWTPQTKIPINIIAEDETYDELQLDQLRSKLLAKGSALISAAKTINTLKETEARLIDNLAKTIKAAKEFEELYKKAKQTLETPLLSSLRPQSAFGSWLYSLALKIG